MVSGAMGSAALFQSGRKDKICRILDSSFLLAILAAID
jgi:hypothetical protein